MASVARRVIWRSRKVEGVGGGKRGKEKEDGRLIGEMRNL